MTHNDIYTKFMIEYDKANVTSSYPALTKYEVATLLDRAYLTLIARKLTGNNTRRVPFEYDTKAIEDLRPLVVTSKFNSSAATTTVSNEYTFSLPSDLMYYLEGVAEFGSEREVVTPVNHQIARKFKATNSNIPWINSPVSYIEGSSIHVFVDPFEHKTSPEFDGTYIKKPASFVTSLTKTEDQNGGENNPGGNNGGGGENPPETVAAPTITSDGEFGRLVNLAITITCVTEGALIYYTTDESAPSENSNLYTSFFTIDKTTTIKAIAIKNNISSSVTTRTFTKQDDTPITVPAPIITGNTTFTDSTTVLIGAIEGATVYYTTDGSDPTENSAIYTRAITLRESTLIKAMAVKSGVNSKISLQLFTKWDTEPESYDISIFAVNLTNSTYTIRYVANTGSYVQFDVIGYKSSSESSFGLNSNNRIYNVGGLNSSDFTVDRADSDYYIKLFLYRDSTLLASSNVLLIEKKVEDDPTPEPYQIICGEELHTKTWTGTYSSHTISIYTKNLPESPYEWKKKDEGKEWETYRVGSLVGIDTLFNGESGWKITAPVFYFEYGKNDPYYVKLFIYNNDRSEVIFSSPEFYIREYNWVGYTQI